jgi:hypothetical protein
MPLTKAQELMIADGLPAAAILTPEERAASWKGRKLSKPRDIKAPKKDEDPTTRQLRKQLEAAEKAKATERFQRLAELRKQTQRARSAPNQETTPMPKTAKKTRNIGTKRAVAASKASAGTGGRKAEVTAMMRRAHGVTTAQVQDATGMLEHSARALISGIRSTLPATEEVVTSKNGAGATVYTIKPKTAL